MSDTGPRISLSRDCWHGTPVMPGGLQWNSASLGLQIRALLCRRVGHISIRLWGRQHIQYETQCLYVQGSGRCTLHNAKSDSDTDGKSVLSPLVETESDTLVIAQFEAVRDSVGIVKQ
mmetsp:Transcript_27995/g.80919  ORF Transcript_27995/g.80919 Transcript_27995/m.80919 type:complete len:118 (-) Transcript_27995:540-893(-)